MRLSIAAATACLAFLTAAAAHAEDPAVAAPHGRQVAVPAEELNLRSPRDAAVLVQRIRAAANEACGPAPSILDLAGTAGYDRCRAAAADRAVAQLNVPAVTLAYRGEPGQPDTARAGGGARTRAR